MKRRTLTAAMLTAPLALGLCRKAKAATSFIYIGSGSTAGLYYPTAVGMADIINDAGIDMRAYVRATAASVFNCRAVGSGELQMGLTQNNIAFYAHYGRGVAAFDGQPQKNLRGLTMLYPEAIHILVRKLANINDVNDLRGKRVHIGDAGSGTEEDVRNVLTGYRMTFDDFRSVVRGSSGDAANLLVDGQIDAMFYTVGIGASAVTQAMSAAGDGISSGTRLLGSGSVDLLDIPTEQIQALHDKFPFYTALTIPAGTYPNIDRPVSTITLKAMLIGSSELPGDVVQTFMEAVFDRDLARFQNNPRNPNLKRYFKLETGLEGMPIPVHAGAASFFSERGIHVPAQLLASN